MVSVIITTKNEEKNIERLLISLKKQSYSKIEIIVVDNNSTDKTIDIAKKYTQKVFNKGPERSVQRNYGVSKSSMKYVLVLDADMELEPDVIKDCLKNIQNFKALIIPEKTVGRGFLASIRRFEREMYMGDNTIEVARFFDKKTFLDFNGYDVNLTGAEDYDLPKRIMNKFGETSIGWSKGWILHHESNLNLLRLLRKKFYYAKSSANYAKKHPDLISTQGNLLFRKAYFRNWRKFIHKPFLGFFFLVVRVLEATSAVLGYINAVGFKEFFKTIFRTLIKND